MTHPTLARLPMYELPATHAFTDAFWTGWRAAMARRGLAGLPRSLDRSPHDETRAGGRLITQTCGITYKRHLRAETHLIATPCYDAPGCAGPDYCSMIVVRRESGVDGLEALAGATAAVNGRGSYSSWIALRKSVDCDDRFFGRIEITGAHLASAEAVAAGRADYAAIDAVCWALFARHAPALHTTLRVVHRTAQVPGLPLIAGPGFSAAEAEIIREGLDAALDDPDLVGARQGLLIAGAERLSPEAYDRL